MSFKKQKQLELKKMIVYKVYKTLPGISNCAELNVYRGRFIGSVKFTRPMHIAYL